jgi:hypothetical protein
MRCYRGILYNRKADPPAGFQGKRPANNLRREAILYEAYTSIKHCR